ncbi:MAG: HlyU family transcriptional regulator [Pseudomonadota bacterium]
MSIFKKLFGGGGDAPAPAAKGEEHGGFTIYVEPIKESAGYRVAARIEKMIDGELKSHSMIRADVISSKDEATSTTLLKAKALIDQQGDRIF